MSAPDLPSAEELVSEVVLHRLGGASFEAIALLHDIPTHRARYYCRRAVKHGFATQTELRLRTVSRPLTIPVAQYNDHWTRRVLAMVKQDEKGCWVWQGSLHPKGYGQTNYRRRTVRVHRQFYEITYGKPPAGKLACHSCDNRRCCNPTHIFLGTEKDNNKDCAKKGRHHNSVKTQCPKGHPYDEINTFWKEANGTRMRGCKTCQRVRMKNDPKRLERQRQYRARRRAREMAA